MVISIAYFAARRPLIEGPGNVDAGSWQISWFRIAKGWGMLPEAFWPGPGIPEGDVIPGEPVNADTIAKPHRLAYYQRLRSELECLYVVGLNRPASAALEVSKAWHSPPGGAIPLDNGGFPSVAVHSIPLNEFDFERERFVFANSWGRQWGEQGIGFLPYGFLTRFMVEAWTAPFTTNCNSPVQLGVHLEVHRGQASKLGVPWIVDVQDGDNDVMVGWAHVMQRERFFDVEELFVRPDYRRQGHATAIANEILKNAPEVLTVRFWIPWGDHSERNAPALISWAKKVGLRIEPSGMRWAAYVATPGAPVDALPPLAWMPTKATCPRYTLVDEEVDEEEVEEADEMRDTWDELRATRRLELIDKKFHGSISSLERDELDRLQSELGRYLDVVAPFPMK